VSARARELALELNRIVLANDRGVLANGEPGVDGAGGLDATLRT
jgi:hypothetical protein